LRILIVASSFPRRPGDWAGVFILNLGRALVRLGHEVGVLSPHVGGSPGRETMEGVEVYRFRYAWPERLETLAYGQGMINNVRENPLRFFLIVPFVLAQAIRLRRMARGVDIVNAHWLIPQGIAAALAAVPFVLTLHGSDVNIRFRGAFGSLMRSLFRLVVKRAAAVTANSSATKRRIEEIVPGIEASVIPMGVDIKLFLGELFSKAAGGSDKGARVADETRIISVGRLIPLKGQEYLISALSLIRERIPGARLILVGDGPERGRLEKMTREAGVGDFVDFTGEVDRDEIPKLLGGSDVFVLPSVVMPTGETEGLGTVLIEAMAACVPVVGSAVGGIVDIIEDGKNGILVEERSPEAIAEAVLKILSDEDFRTRIVSRGMEDAGERFSWEGIAAKFEELFHELKEVSI